MILFSSRSMNARLFALAGVALLLSFAGWGSVSSAQAAGSRYYSGTGHSVGGAFLRYYDSHGGLRIFGLPLSDEISEGGRTVQYFERERFEYHSEFAGTANEVELGLLGVDAASRDNLSAARTPAFASQPERVYFSETGHSLSNAFYDFWRANGGLGVLGYPISEPVSMNGLTVQYFQRARMEYHPELAPRGYGVELTLLGRDYLQAHGQSGHLGGASASQVTSAISVAQAPAGHVMNALEQDLFNRINAARQAGGLAPVAYDPRIGDIALARSNDMATNNYFSHDAPNGKTYMALLKAAHIPFSRVGEIISWNTYDAGQTSYQTFNNFMNSAPHHAIIMTGAFNAAGVGEVRDNSGKYFYTVVFIQR